MMSLKRSSHSEILNHIESGDSEETTVWTVLVLFLRIVGEVFSVAIKG
jgi:hypothetical protein